MGLDMYLSRRIYLSGHDFEKDKPEYAAYQRVVEAIGIKPVAFTPSLTVSVNVAYWRKANAIHNWFVQNLADGVDECQPVYVSVENLKDLRTLVREVLGNKEKAGELLPTSEGFFFGGTEYDNWYFENLKGTDTMLTEVLDSVKDVEPWAVSFEYVASW